MKHVLMLAALLLAGTVSAQIPDLNLSTVTIQPDAVGACVIVDPDGGGTPFTAAFAPGGGTVDATITVTLVDAMGEPIVGFPGSDLWLESTGGGLARCAGWGTFADGSTDQNGQTTWHQPKLAGGCTVGELARVMVLATPMPGGVGSSAENEGFTAPYDLPDEEAYAETCAAARILYLRTSVL